MGVMIEGVFHADAPGADTTLGGTYERSASTIRNWISASGTEVYVLTYTIVPHNNKKI